MTNIGYFPKEFYVFRNKQPCSYLCGCLDVCYNFTLKPPTDLNELPYVSFGGSETLKMKTIE